MTAGATMEQKIHNKKEREIGPNKESQRSYLQEVICPQKALEMSVASSSRREERMHF